VRRSGILKGAVEWVLVLEVSEDMVDARRSPTERETDGWQDPDGRFIRLYTQQTHEMTADVDRDNYWLGSVER